MVDLAIVRFRSFFARLIEKLESGSSQINFEQHFRYVYDLRCSAGDKEEFQKVVFECLENVAENNELYILSRDVCMSVVRNNFPTFGS